MQKIQEILTWLAKSDWPYIVFGVMFYLRNKKDILGSFTNKDEGFSARKLTGFICVVTAIKLSVIITMTKPNNELVYAWMTFGALCLGLVTYEQIIKLRGDKKEEAK